MSEAPFRVWMTGSAEETRALGRALGRLLEPGDVVCLRGEMGAGKTTLAQGIGIGLDVAEPVCSPTFTLAQEYHGRCPVHHLDPYRIRSEGDLLDLGWYDLLRSPVVLLVEWPERLGDALPPDRLEVALDTAGDGDERTLTARASGPRSAAILQGWDTAVAGTGD